jgi:hypothetical protein
LTWIAMQEAAIYADIIDVAAGRRSAAVAFSSISRRLHAISRADKPVSPCRSRRK